MAERLCERCEGVLPKRARVDARFCGDACRQAAHRARHTASAPRPCVPRELAEAPRWVRYSHKKVPLRPDGRGVASSVNPRTWSTYDRALASTEGVGAGFVLTGDGIVCVDLDHCWSGGVLAPWARRIVDRAGSTWMEVSPSGDGLHIWGRAHMTSGRVVNVPGGGKAEIYPNGRYITVTHRTFGDTPAVLGDLSEVIGELIT
ncbi:DNA primase [Embleya sp. NPDC005971]|uniref:DNA primase n=1 Tax=Embleya sp. NPDC005971 TaxID=3156724 RepID=UPI0033F1B17B